MATLYEFQFIGFQFDTWIDTWENQRAIGRHTIR